MDPQHTLLLDKCLLEEEIDDGIDALKCTKSPRVDWLTVKLYKMYKSILASPLLAVWQEAALYRALPDQ